MWGLGGSSNSTVAMSDDEMRVQWKRVTERRNAAEAALRVANEESDRWYQQMMQRGLIP